VGGRRYNQCANFSQANPNKTKQNCLDFLGFIRPNRDFSMGYGQKNTKKSTRVSSCVQNVSGTPSPFSRCARQGRGLHPVNMKIIAIISEFVK
jgi:hypothetical protein